MLFFFSSCLWWQQIIPTPAFNEKNDGLVLPDANHISVPNMFNLKPAPASVQPVSPLRKKYADVMKIKGILYNKNEGLAWVIIEINGKQTKYQTHSQLSGFDNVTLSKINKNAIILSTPEGEERLKMGHPDYFKK